MQGASRFRTSSLFPKRNTQLRNGKINSISPFLRFCQYSTLRPSIVYNITDTKTPEIVLPPDLTKLPRLLHDLESVIFSEGLKYKDNFSSSIWKQVIHTPIQLRTENFGAYHLPSKDEKLLQKAKSSKSSIVTSTSSFSPLLSKMYYLISNTINPILTLNANEEIQITYPQYHVKKYFPTAFNVTKCKENNHSIYALDIQKNKVEQNLLSILGKSIEKMLTTEEEEYLSRYTKIKNPEQTQEIIDTEYYHYLRKGMIMCRSQLDCTGEIGTFDIKSRAVQSIRTNFDFYQANQDLLEKPDLDNDYIPDREFLMMKNGMLLKHNFQVRLGKMKGIFIAYHNTAQFMGFEYVSKELLDSLLYGSVIKGDKFFEIMMKLSEICLKLALAKVSTSDFTIMFFGSGTSLEFIVKEDSPSDPLFVPTLYHFRIAVDVYRNREKIIIPNFKCSDNDSLELLCEIYDLSETTSQKAIANQFLMLTSELQ